MSDERDIEQIIIRYALACDSRNWPLMDSVFTEDVIAVYGGEASLAKRSSIINMIQRHLNGCGSTQHLLGNFRIAIDGNNATCATYIRAAHVGRGDKAGMIYEVWGEYRDELIRTTEGWRICKRDMVIFNETGSREVLRAS
jgi:hypothetical protein